MIPPAQPQGWGDCHQIAFRLHANSMGSGGNPKESPCQEGRSAPLPPLRENRVISDCHFRKTGTEYDKKPGIKWLSCTEK
jgi:hypothetical protein